MNWYVLHTKHRNEIKATTHLEKMGITVYCPLTTKIHQWSDRKKKIETPLIPSYIFVQLKERERKIVFEVPGVVNYLFWLGKAAIVRDAEITVMKEWIQGTTFETRVESMRPGDHFQITEGPFQGKEGIIHKVTKNQLQLFLVNLRMKIIISRNKHISENQIYA